jgi:hypothetical protein
MITKDKHATPIYRYTTKEAALEMAGEWAETGGNVYVMEAVALAKPKVEITILADTSDGELKAGHSPE